ncbi:MAG: hypothetical protein P8P70_07915 [Sulfitobacter sp.]|nr:hypothetical protein [Sulfitobacter sp.]
MAATGMETSVLPVFGENLRLLSEARGPLSAAAQGLGLSKTQFYRYLKAESFPKPHQLKHICEYFDVDARILTEPLNDALLYAMRSGTGQVGPGETGLIEGLNFACSTQDYFSDTGGMADGFYALYRHSMAFKGKYVRILLFIKTLEKARVVRWYDSKRLYPENVVSSMREFRGVVHKTADGHAVVFYHNPPLQAISLMFLAPILQLTGLPAYMGFACLGRAILPNKSRYSEVYMEYLPGGVLDALKFQRQEAFLERDELPMAAQVLPHAPFD